MREPFIEITHPDVETTVLVHPRSLDHHRRAGWSPVGESTDPQPAPAGPQVAPVAGAPEHTEE